MDSSRCTEKQKAEEDDRISVLPEELLSHILSNLDTKEAVQTCLLSKTWRYSWFNLTSFKFYRGFSLNTFVKKICSALPDGFQIYKLTIHSFLNEPISTTLMESGILRNLQQLHLEGVTVVYGTLFMDHVKTLTLTRVHMYWSRDDVLNLNFPKVENLFLHDFALYAPMSNPLIISAPRLAYLSVKSIGKWGNRVPGMIEINARDIIRLDLKVPFKAKLSLEFDELPSLVRANIDTSTRSLYGKKLDESKSKKLVLNLHQILKGVCSAKWLTISTEYFQFLFQLVLECLQQDPVRFHNTKYLKLNEFHLDDDKINAVGVMLESFPHLDTLVLENLFASPQNREDKSAPIDASCQFGDLKNIEFLTYDGSEDELKFLKFLVMNAMALETITIVVMSGNNVKEMIGSLLNSLKSWGVMPKFAGSEIKCIDETVKNHQLPNFRTLQVVFTVVPCGVNMFDDNE